MLNLTEPIKNIEDLNSIKEWLKNYNIMYYVIFIIGINSGLRISDILGLTIDEVKNCNKIEIVEQKTGKHKQFPINNEIRKVIDLWLPIRVDKFTYKEADNYLFVGRKGCKLDRSQPYRILKRAVKELNLDINIGTHSMRKTFGYHHYRQFKDVVLLQKIFNHSTPQITLRYIGMEQEEIDNSYRAFSYNKNRPKVNNSDILKELEQIKSEIKAISKPRYKPNKTIEFLKNYLNSGGIKHREFAQLALQGG